MDTFNKIDFNSALSQALIDANYLGHVRRSKYVLIADLIEVDKYDDSGSSTINVIAEYKLIERKSGKEISRKAIETSNKASSHRLAIKSSVINNIYQLLKVLSILKIEKS